MRFVGGIFHDGDREIEGEWGGAELWDVEANTETDRGAPRREFNLVSDCAAVDERDHGEGVLEDRLFDLRAEERKPVAADSIVVRW